MTMRGIGTGRVVRSGYDKAGAMTDWVTLSYGLPRLLTWHSGDLGVGLWRMEGMGDLGFEGGLTISPPRF